MSQVVATNHVNAVGTRVSILVAEDDGTQVALLRKMVAGDATISHVAFCPTLSAAIERAKTSAPDAILLDLNLPDSEGTSTVRRFVAEVPSLPVVVLTSQDDEETATEALRLGAQDFLVKGRITAPQLIRSLRYSIERKRTDLKLHASQRQLEELNRRHDAILRSIPQGVATLSADWGVLWTNRALVEFLGFPADCPHGFSFQALFPSVAEFDSYKASARNSVHASGIDRRELLLRLPSGKERWTEITLVRSDPKASGAGYLVTLVDVTDRREREEAVLQSTKLDAIGMMAGVVAHDFNNLLTIIRGYTCLALGQVPGSREGYESLAKVLVGVRRATSLVSQLLAVSRRQPYNPVAVDLNFVVEESRILFQRLVGEGIVLDVDLDHGVFPVFADPTHIEQVLLNLVVNARDALCGEGFISIRTYNRYFAIGEEPPGGTPGDHAALAVIDNGTGIPPEILPKLFEPFFTTKGDKAGTGLGLSTVHSIAIKNRGFLTVESELGEGTTFTLFLPRSDSKPEPRTADPITPGTPMPKATILAVEDDAEVRSLVAEVLQGAGFEVLVAASPEEAVLKAENHAGQVDLAICDVVLASTSGPAVILAVQPFHPNMRVLFTSGYPQDVVEQRGAGNAELLRKPFGPEQLLERIEKMLRYARER